MALKKSELYSSLWKSCDELRGGMDASQYKDYVLVLLFVKYVSDKYAADPNALIEVPAGGGFADMVVAKGDKEIGDRINKIIGRLADANDSLKGAPSTAVPSYWGGSIRWMNSGELNLKTVNEVEGRITELGLRNSSTTIVPVNCVLVGLAGQGKTRGTVAMNSVELCTNQSIAAIFPKPTFEPAYLYYNLDSRYDELRSLSTGDGGRGGLNLTIIRSIVVPFPKLEEQRAIATVLSDMDAEIAALEARRDKTRTLKQGMMQELLTGRIRLV